MTSPKTSRMKKRVCERYAQYGTLTKASEGVINRRIVYDWRQQDPDFEAELSKAAEIYVEKLEEEADRRGVEGVDKGVYYLGDKVATEKQFSDTLLIFRLKALAPDKYRERQEISGNIAHILVKEVEVRLTPIQREERLALNNGGG